tara:strand:- start:538 stop:1869 length:1332 start_codon:yes stop_codon:yes gene_type:complete
MNQSFFIKTYGCQMNDYDSDKMEELLTFNGFNKVTNFEKSDVAILNTCHIRKKASDKLYSDLGRLSIFKENKNKLGKQMQIIVTGCVAQAEGEEIIKRNKSVDYVIGPQNFHIIPDLVRKKNSSKVYTDFLCEEKFESLPVSNVKNISRLVTIQEGCDKFCTFCVVPYTRGAEYSRPVEDIFAEVLQYSKFGTSEITLLGQNVSSYSSRIYEDSKKKEVPLSGLLKILSRISGLKRIRYLTSHPSDITDELISEHKKNKLVMPFLHLPIQSGSNEILKLMNRKHTKEEYLRIIKKIKKEVPKMAFSSDFIVGYPGESDTNFEETLDLIEKVGFASSYSFKYSPRPGTPASTKKNFIDESTSNMRLKKIQELLNKQQRYFNDSFIGKTMDVLISGKGKKENQYVGRTPYLQPVHIMSSKSLTGKILKIKIESLTSFSFHGKILN